MCPIKKVFPFAFPLLLQSILRVHADSNLRGSIPEKYVAQNTSIAETMDQPSVLCRLTIMNTMYPQGYSPETQDEKIHCIPIIDYKESTSLYPIRLPQEFLEMHHDRIHTGRMLVTITGANVTENGLEVALHSKFDAILDVPAHLRHLFQTTFTTGRKTLAVLRLSTEDSSPTYSLDELKSYIVDGAVNMIDQFSACSYDQLNYVLSDTAFMDFKLSNKVTDFSTPELLVEAAEKQLGERYMAANEIADTVVMCLPPGTGNWLAKAPLNHWRAIFNDEWCISLTCLMHEIGHLMGLHHSGRDGNQYADITGYMSWGLRSPTYPRKCYNGEKSWDLGWYKERQLLLNPTTDGPAHFNLAAITDYKLAATDEPVVVSIDDGMFLLYNRMKSFNDQTEEKQDQVTITQRTTDWSNSLAGLSAGQKYTVSNYGGTGKDLIIEACKRTDGSGDQADIMEVSVGLGTSLCGTPITVAETTTVTIPTDAPIATPVPHTITVSPAAAPSQSGKCAGNLISNSGMELGYDGYWIADGRGGIENLSNYKTGNAITNTHRLRTTDGLVYNTDDHFDSSCLVPGATYLFNFDVQVIDKATGQPAVCDPLNDCPRLRLVLRQGDRQLVFVESIAGYNLPSGGWEANEFNHFSQAFTFPATWDGSVRQFQLEILDFPTQWDSIVDNFTMRRLN